MELKVGALARRTGLTVRTLHHWEDVGLLEPARRTDAGHRVYGPEEIRTLHRILSLRQTGLSLEETRAYLQGGEASLRGILESQRERVREQVDLLRTLEEKLDRILRLLDSERVEGEDDLLETMELMARIEAHFSPEQIRALKGRREALGPEAIEKAEEDWPRLIARVREEMDRGTDPTAPEVLELAGRWRALVEAFSGGDREIERSVATMYRHESDVARRQGLDPALFRYIGAAMQALKKRDGTG